MGRVCDGVGGGVGGDCVGGKFGKLCVGFSELCVGRFWCGVWFSGVVFGDVVMYDV